MVLEARKVKKKFNDRISREEHKTIFSSLRISEMTLSFSGIFQSPECRVADPDPDPGGQK
jgi:hypothetical protein